MSDRLRGVKDDGQAKSIWIISKYASSSEYGFESRLFALAREFSNSGRKPVIISSDSNHLAAFPHFDSRYTRETPGGFETWWIRTLRYTKTVSVRRVLSWIDFELKLFLMPKKQLPSPDVIIVSSLSLLTILNGVWLRRRYGCKLIFEIRDIWPLTLTEEGGYSDSNPFVRLLAWVERFGYRRADLVVGTMPNLAEHVAGVAGDGIACECVPFGFNPSAFNKQEPLPPDYPAQHIPRDRFVIGYAGSIGLTNALDTIITCARELAEDTRYFFVFLGGGDLLERYMEETRDLENVMFLPKVKRVQVQAVLKSCDILYFAVHDSPVWKFGMSLNKLIDYMMAAKPVLASYNGFPSMLDEAACGEFVPADDVASLRNAIHRFSEMPTERLVEMGERGRAWLLENRRWDVLARQYLDICDGLCGEVAKRQAT
jgi:glycosyltransferase involved in cell wall biosynthesis